MNRIQLIGIAPCFNELSKGHLERFFLNIPKVVDGLVLLDDASTDGSYELMKEYTPYVLKNTSNRFVYEQENTEILIKEALLRFPDLTHILTLNIDSSFSPACFKDGDAQIHKCLEKYPERGMWVARNVHLWRSDCWYRCDKGWKDDTTERVYVRSHSLEMANKNRKGLHHGKVTKAGNWGSMTAFYPEVVSLHWGFSTKKLIEEKVYFYLDKEHVQVPSPQQYEHTNVFKLLDEFNLKLDGIDKKWIDSDIKRCSELREPMPVSYYSHIMRYNSSRAEEYKKYFIHKLGYHSEEETYKELK